METFLAITTFNQVEYTRKCLDSIRLAGIDADVIIFDDASTDDTLKLEATIVTKPKGRGLTDSWNMAYKWFRDSEYKYFFLFNNDILIPRGAIENMIEVLKYNIVVAPLTTRKGARGKQMVNSYHIIHGSDNPDNYQEVQDSLLPLNTVRISPFNGFAFGMNRDIIDFELPDGNLFDPKNINVGNEDELNSRIVAGGKSALLCTRAFIFHFKDVTFNYHKHKIHRDNLTYYRCLS
jgi:GT2 family glycosyltransferase